MNCFKLKFIKFYSFMVGIFTDAQSSWAPFLCKIQSWDNSSGYNCTRTTNNHFWRWREVTSWLKTEKERKEKLDWGHNLIDFTDLTVILQPWCGSLHKKKHLKSLFLSFRWNTWKIKIKWWKRVPASILCTSIQTTREEKKCLVIHESM